MPNLIPDYAGSGLGSSNGAAFFSESGAVVPVPAVAWLFPAGLIAGLGWMRRRRFH